MVPTLAAIWTDGLKRGAAVQTPAHKKIGNAVKKTLARPDAATGAVLTDFLTVIDESLEHNNGLMGAGLAGSSSDFGQC